MLPLLRILPVGGVSLAIMIVILALNPPGDAHTPAVESSGPVRGALTDARQHPEWRQFLIHAAVRRAGEIERLRELPDTPVRIPDPEPPPPAVAPEEPPAPPAAAEPPAQTAALPTERIDAEPEADETGSISELPAATIPIDIGATSSSELPVILPPEAPPVIRTPVRVKPQDESRAKPPAKRRARAPAKPVAQPAPTIFETIFGSAQNQQPATAQAARPAASARRTSPPAPAQPSAAVSADQR